MPLTFTPRTGPHAMRVFWADSAYSQLFSALGYVPRAEHEAGCHGSQVPALGGTQQAESA